MLRTSPTICPFLLHVLNCLLFLRSFTVSSQVVFFFSRLYYTFIDRPTLKHDGFQKDTTYGIWPQGQLCLKPMLLPSIVQMSTTQQSGKNIQKYGIEFCQAMTKWQKSGECRMSECHNCVQRLFLKNLYTFSQFCLFRVGSWGNGLRLGFQTTLTS